MRRKPVPEALKQGPIMVAQAEAAGVSRFRLRGAGWRRLGRGRYVWAGAGRDDLLDLRSLAQRLPTGFAFSHLAAARVFGLDVDRGAVVDVTFPARVAVSGRAGVRTHRADLDGHDLVWRDGLPATSPLRTSLDVARDLPLIEAVVVIDMVLHERLADLTDLRAYLGCHAGAPGVRRARRAIDLAEPRSESPMESRLRMILVLAGLPRPEVQVNLREGLRFLGRPDLYYPGARLCIEYDGEGHRDRLTSDNRRQNRLVGAGYELLRYTAADVHQRPAHIVSEVAHRLGHRSCA